MGKVATVFQNVNQNIVLECCVRNYDGESTRPIRSRVSRTTLVS